MVAGLEGGEGEACRRVIRDEGVGHGEFADGGVADGGVADGGVGAWAEGRTE